MIFGYLILGETPTYNMIVGAIIITLSGLFVIKREKEIGKIKQNFTDPYKNYKLLQHDL